MQAIEKNTVQRANTKLSAALGFCMAFFLTWHVSAQPSNHNNDDIIVFAASSLAPLMEALSARYNDAHDSKMRVAYGASGGLARQIAAGAPADIFMTADKDWLSWLADSGKPLAQASPFVANSLVFAYGSNDDLPSDASIAQILDATPGARIGIGAPNSVPVGRYAKEALQNMQLWDSVEARITPAGSANALGRMLRAKGVPMGITFTSENIEGMQTLPIPPNTHERITYMIGITKNGNSENSRTAIDFLMSEPSLTLAQSMGFATLDGANSTGQNPTEE